MNVTVYTTADCSSCKATKEYLKSNNIEFTEKDVSKSKAFAMEMIKVTGQKALPVIDIDGKIIIGYDQDKLDELLGI